MSLCYTNRMPFSIYTAISYTCWIILFSIWIISALGSKKTVKRTDLGRSFLSTILITIGFTLIFDYHLSSVFAIPLLPHSVAIGRFGMALTILSCIFAIAARYTLGRNWAGAVTTLKEHHELAQTGPYRIVRHPIYTGFLFGAIGTALTIGTVASACGVTLLLIAFLTRIPTEEHLMMTQFPNTYPAYRKGTKMLIPFVW